MMKTEGKLSGRRILITGAASGMGRAIAVLFHREGAHVALLDLNGPAVTELARELEGFGAECDISSAQQVADSVAAAIAALGGLDGVVNAAGLYYSKAFEETDLESWNRVMAVNVNGPYHILQTVLPALRQSATATIVNIASISGYLPMAGTAAYSTSKAAVLMLTKSLGFELGPHIRVNAICPGVIKTEMTRHIWEDPARAASTSDRVALKKMGEAEDIAKAALYLSSEDSSFATGTEIVLDGGFSWR
jgi:NAD(P)-dependent dehydrogenase (short-subunit alcohol dehydrogenase family)